MQLLLYKVEMLDRPPSLLLGQLHDNFLLIGKRNINKQTTTEQTHKKKKNKQTKQNILFIEPLREHVRNIDPGSLKV